MENLIKMIKWKTKQKIKKEKTNKNIFLSIAIPNQCYTGSHFYINRCYYRECNILRNLNLDDIQRTRVKLPLEELKHTQNTQLRKRCKTNFKYH